MTWHALVFQLRVRCTLSSNNRLCLTTANLSMLPWCWGSSTSKIDLSLPAVTTEAILIASSIKVGPQHHLQPFIVFFAQRKFELRHGKAKWSHPAAKGPTSQMGSWGKERIYSILRTWANSDETIEIQCLPCVRSHHSWLQANHQQIRSDDDFWQSHSQSPILLSTGLPNIWHPSSPAKQDGRCKDESAEWCMMLGCLIDKMTSSLPWAVFIKFLAPFRYERNILRNVELGFFEFQSCQLCWNPWLQSCFFGQCLWVVIQECLVIHVRLVVHSIKLQVTLHPSGLVWHTPTPPKITLW